MNPILPIQSDPVVPGSVPDTPPAGFDPGKALEFQRMLDRGQVGKPRERGESHHADEARDAKSPKHASEEPKRSKDPKKEVSESTVSPHANDAGEAEPIQGEEERLSDGEGSSDKESGDVLAGALEGSAFSRKKRSLDDFGADPRGGSGQGSMASTSAAIRADFVRESGIVDRVGQIEQISALIAQTAQQIDFQGHDGATITLSPTQLPDSKVRIEMQQGVIQVTFNSTDASSLSLLQARGGEIAAILQTRFDHEVRIDVREGDESDDAGTSRAPLASWTVSGRSSSGDGAGTGGTPS